jgi:RHS repeat-associated protein
MKQFARVVAGLVLFWIGVAAQARTVHLYYTDPQGTVLAKTDAQGNILARYDYRPYGGVVSGNGPDGPGYTGHVQDPETGLVYMQARYYDPAGRFPSPDPVKPSPGDIYSFNRYAYAGNNPVNRTDPTGMFQCDNKASCAAGTRLRNDFKKAQQHFKSGSSAYKSLAAGIKALGTANDGGAIHVAVVTSGVNALGWGGAPKGKIPTLTINLAQLEGLPRSQQSEAGFAATGRHELQHVMDDMVAGDVPHDVKNEFWHEVRGVRAETPIWEGLGDNDPWGTWTSRGGLNMKAVYQEAEASTNLYCPNGTCP